MAEENSQGGWVDGLVVGKVNDSIHDKRTLFILFVRSLRLRFHDVPGA